MKKRSTKSAAKKSSARKSAAKKKTAKKAAAKRKVRKTTGKPAKKGGGSPYFSPETRIGVGGGGVRPMTINYDDDEIL